MAKVRRIAEGLVDHPDVDLGAVFHQELARLEELRGLEATAHAAAKSTRDREERAEAQQVYHVLLRDRMAQHDRVLEAHARLVQHETEQRLTSHWEGRRAEIEEALSEAYGNLGPQYDILKRLVVDAELRREQMQESGRAITTAEWAQANRVVLDGVRALQRYTEAQKSEIVREGKREGAEAALKLVEEVLAQDNPHLWQKVAHHVATTLAEEVA